MEESSPFIPNEIKSSFSLMFKDFELFSDIDLRI